jgi:hypothetical protein
MNIRKTYFQKEQEIPFVEAALQRKKQQQKYITTLDDCTRLIF